MKGVDTVTEAYECQLIIAEGGSVVEDICRMPMRDPFISLESICLVHFYSSIIIQRWIAGIHVASRNGRVRSHV